MCKVHKILLGSALFELFEIKTTSPPKQEKKTNEHIDINVNESYSKVTVLMLADCNNFVRVCMVS